MILVMGVVLIVASIAWLQLGRWYVNRPGVSDSTGRSFAGEVFALVFTTTFSFGFVLTLGQAIMHLDAVNVAKVVVAIVIAWLGSRQVAAYARRLEARRTAVLPPKVGAVPH